MAAGAHPIDPTTATGLFRTELGDVVGTPHEPADGLAEYEYVSDAQIDALIAAYPESRNMAFSKALSMMATQMIAAAQDIQVDDIRIKTVERAKLMLEQANVLMGVALGGDADNAVSIIPLRGKTSPSGVQGLPDAWAGVM